MAQGRHLWFWRQKENMPTWKLGWNEFFFAFPRTSIKLYLLPGVQLHYTSESSPLGQGSLRRQNRNRVLTCLHTHSFVICVICPVFCNLGCSVTQIIVNHIGFCLHSWWSCIYLLGLSWEIICALSKEYSHFARTTFNSERKKKKKRNSILQGKLLCKNTASCIIGSTVITLSLKPAWWEWFLYWESEDFLLEIALKSELFENHLPIEECEHAFILDCKF